MSGSRTLGLALTLASTTWLATAGCGAEGVDCTGHSHEPECLACTGAEDPYDMGFERLGERGVFAIRLARVEPSPHVVGNNILEVEVVDAQGAPLEGVAFDLVETHTVAGGHGTPIEPWVQELGMGRYQISDLNYIHFGVWEVRFELSLDTRSDRIVFTLCIDEAAGRRRPTTTGSSR